MTSLVTEQRLAPCLTLSLLALLASVCSLTGRYTHFPMDIFAVQFCVVTYHSRLPSRATLMSKAELCFATGVRVFGSGNKLLNHIQASGETSPIHGYLINSYQFQTSKVTSSFWKLQLPIIAQLRLIRLLSVVVAVVIRDHNCRSVTAFV